MNGDAAPFVVAPFAFADVNSCTNWNAPGGKGTDEFQRAMNRLGGSLEQCEDAVARVAIAAVASNGTI
jgi:hypothetical protein